MKIIIIFIVFLLNTSIEIMNSKSDCPKFTISIWDFNSSLAYTMLYEFDNKTMTIRKISGIENERDSVLIKKQLTAVEQKLISDLLSSVDYFKLGNKYSHPLRDDGDQKRIVISFRKRTKVIEVSNVFQNEISILINTLNEIIRDELRLTLTQ